MSIITRIYAGEGDLRLISDQVWKAIVAGNDPPELFRNGDRVVWIERDDCDMPVMREVTQARLKHYLTGPMKFFRLNKHGQEVSARPPKDLPADLLARPDKTALPYLRRVVSMPVYGRSGVLHVNSGYSTTTGFYLISTGLDNLPAVPSAPDAADLALARDAIWEVLRDFPFAGPSEIAHAVGAILLPFVQPLINGPTPLHLIEKPVAGTGATLLALVISYVALGTFPATVTPPRDEAEWRRGLLSWLRDGPTVLLIDNVRDTLSSAALASAITSTVFRDRIIGQSDAVSVPVECLWLATGNNPSLSNEMARRTVRIRLDAKMQHPDIGRKYRHPDLRAWVIERRASLVWSLLTCVRAWVSAGQPQDIGVSPLGMFENWSRVIGGILTLMGVEGFLKNRDEVRRISDGETARVLPFMHSWWGKYRDARVAAADLANLASDLDLGGGNEHSRRIRLGTRLEAMRDRCFENFRIEDCGIYQGSHRYRLLWVSEGENE